MAVKNEYRLKVNRHDLIRIMSALFVAHMKAHEAYLLTGGIDEKITYEELCQIINKIDEQRKEQE